MSCARTASTLAFLQLSFSRLIYIPYTFECSQIQFKKRKAVTAVLKIWIRAANGRLYTSERRRCLSRGNQFYSLRKHLTAARGEEESWTRSLIYPSRRIKAHHLQRTLGSTTRRRRRNGEQLRCFSQQQKFNGINFLHFVRNLMQTFLLFAEQETWTVIRRKEASSVGNFPRVQGCLRPQGVPAFLLLVFAEYPWNQIEVLS